MRTMTHRRLFWAFLSASVTVLLLCGTGWSQEKAVNPVVPNAILGPFQFPTYPSLVSGGQSWTHLGVDLIAKEGSPVYAFGDGRVVAVITQSDPEYSWAGNAVMIEHPASPPLYTIYLHLSKISLLPDTPVKAGTSEVGQVGHTGHANGVDHVHFEIRRFKKWLSQWGNIYAPGDQRSSPYLKANWEDPLVWFKRYPTGMPSSGTLAPSAEAERSGPLDYAAAFNHRGAKWIFNRKTVSSRGTIARRLEISSEGITTIDGANVTQVVRKGMRPNGSEYFRQVRYMTASAEAITLIGWDFTSEDEATSKWRFRPAWPVLKNPVVVGAMWEQNGQIDISGKTHKYDVQVEVQSRELINVPAGRFETFKVVTRFLNEITTEWWAKGVGVVRRELAGGSGVISTDELVEYKGASETTESATAGKVDQSLLRPAGERNKREGPSPTSYGVYVRDNSGLIELRPESAETSLANVSGPYALYPRCCAKGPHPRLPDGSIEVVVFLRGLTGINPVLREFVYVRELEKVQVDLFGRPKPQGYRSLVKPGEWIAAYDWPVTVSPVSNQPDMIIVRPRAGKLTAGLYGFAIEPSGHPATRYPQSGQLMFWVGIDPNDKTTRCTDWEVKLSGLSDGEVTIRECSIR